MNYVRKAEGERQVDMDEKPILFSGEMVRAILQGRKTQTRRVIKPQPVQDPDESWRFEIHPRSGYNTERTMRHYLPDRCRYGKPGDRLWVRETWVCYDPSDGEQYYKEPIPESKPEGIGIAYRADHSEDPGEGWRPSIFMPRWASRITLEIADVRIERVQEISIPDCWSEGVTVDEVLHLSRGQKPSDIINAFATLWNTINDDRGYGWEVNPWVWVIGFKVVRNG